MNCKLKGDQLWTRTDKISSELLCFTYGALVVQLLQDMEDVGTVNLELEKMYELPIRWMACSGYNMGIRLVDEVLAKAGIPGCQNWKDTAEVVAKVWRWKQMEERVDWV